MKKCLKCGTENAAGALFCVSCGEKLQQEPAHSFCVYCGTEMEKGALFCPGCGQQVSPESGENPQMEPMDSGVEQQPVNDSGRKGMKAAVIALSAIAAVIAVVLATAFIRIHSFKNYVTSFQKECQAYPSLGVYEEDYGQQMDEAKEIITGFKFWRTGNLKDRMEELSRTVADMNEKVAKYQQAYQETLAKFEQNGNYYTGDYEQEYKDSKTACEDALKRFDENDSRDKTEAFTKLVDKIISYNEKEGAGMVSSVKKAGSNVSSCEKYLLSQKADQVKKSYQAKNFKQEKDDYEEYQSWRKKFTTRGTIDDYVQVDVSENNKINLYVNGSDKNESWNKNSFLIFEKKNKSNQWTQCTVEEIQQVKGNMSMDLVADISTSMDYQFGEMQSCLTQFVEETEPDTSLGLSTISSVYNRELTFTRDKNTVESAINNLQCQGCTALYQSLYSSVLYTASATGSRCVVAFTDGINEPYESGYDYYENDVINIAKTYQIPIYIIGIGDGIEEYTLKNIANSTGGRYWNIDYVSDLYNIYEQIYEMQKSVYQIRYSSSLKNKENRQVYVYGESSNGADVIRFQNDIDAEVLADAYASGNEVDSSNLASYYTKKKYISQYDLENIGSVNDVQTIINIYYAKNGYKFTNPDVLATMKSLGVISKNGTKSMDAAAKEIKKNAKLYKNLMALYNYRYELLYRIGYDAYWNKGYRNYDSFTEEVNYQAGESASSTRYSSIIKKIFERVQE